VRTHELRTMSINATATTCEYSAKSLRHEPELRTKMSGESDGCTDGPLLVDVGRAVGRIVGRGVSIGNRGRRDGSFVGGAVGTAFSGQVSPGQSRVEVSQYSHASLTRRRRESPRSMHIDGRRAARPARAPPTCTSHPIVIVALDGTSSVSVPPTTTRAPRSTRVAAGARMSTSPFTEHRCPRSISRSAALSCTWSEPLCSIVTGGLRGAFAHLPTMTSDGSDKRRSAPLYSTCTSPPTVCTLRNAPEISVSALFVLRYRSLPKCSMRAKPSMRCSASLPSTHSSSTISGSSAAVDASRGQ